MNTTTNYGLKQYEGTDLFNPLTVENVNMGDIDTALKAVSDHAVGTATELTTGTVHALTRADTDRDVFAFVATSNYESGDTFTLDGTQVSALTPDGQPLATGSYVIGSTVLCALHDTLITVYVNPAKAKDSDKLDGHDSSYFATDSDLDTVAGTIQAVSDKVGSAVLTTTAPDLSGAVNELNTQLTSVTNCQISTPELIGKWGNKNKYRVCLEATPTGLVANTPKQIASFPATIDEIVKINITIRNIANSYTESYYNNASDYVTAYAVYNGSDTILVWLVCGSVGTINNGKVFVEIEYTKS